MKPIKWITSVLLVLSFAGASTACRAGAGVKVGSAKAAAGASVK